VAAIRAARRVLLLGHVSPDGDALGSALAVGLALRNGDPDVEVQVSFGDDPFVLPGNLTRLPGLELLVPPDDVVAPDVAVSFDASSADRLGSLRDVAEAAPAFIAVDHHASYDGFGSLALVDISAPATAVLADRLIERLGLKVDADVAANLYTGLVTDTGSFRYAGTTSQTLAFAGRLLDTGIRFDLIARDLFDSVPFAYLGLLGRALDRAVLEPGAAGGLGLVWTVVPELERAQSGLAIDMVEPVIDSVRKAVEAEVAVVVKEDDDGVLRVSLRSKGRIDVSGVAVLMGGGGHRFAAGYTSTTTDLQELVARLRELLAEAPHLQP
jgi:phosphoesterase RecJ-like protein